MKKFFALICAAILLFSLAVPVFADDGSEVGTAAPEPYGRDYPAPIGMPQTYHYATRIHDYNATVTIKSVERGNTALEIIQTANSFNHPAPDGMEYIVARVSFSLVSSRNYSNIYLTERLIKVFSTEREEYKLYWLSPVFPEDNFRGDVFPGGTREGYVAFLVSKSDAHPVALIGDSYAGDGGAWFRLS